MTTTPESTHRPVYFSAGGVMHANDGHGLAACGKRSPYGDAPTEVRSDGFWVTCKRCKAQAEA